MNQVYLDSARLLTRVAPLVLVDKTFALKGGTAINLFVRNMPRLSVDLDLVFSDKTLPRDRMWLPLTASPKSAGIDQHSPSAIHSVQDCADNVLALPAKGGVDAVKQRCATGPSFTSIPSGQFPVDDQRT